MSVTAINKIIYTALLLIYLTACSSTQTPAPENTLATGVNDFAFKSQYFRGTNLGFTEEVKAKMRAADVNIVVVGESRQENLSTNISSEFSKYQEQDQSITFNVKVRDETC